MSLIRPRALLAAGTSASLLAGLAVADPTGATTSQHTLAETSVATTPETVADTSVATTPEGAAVEILPPDEPWAGLTRAEWDARLWQWVVSLPADVNPNVNGSSEFCGYGQFGPMFFLPGNLEGRAPENTCVVAEGTAIYSSVSGGCSTVEPPPYFGRTEDELRACATALLDDFPAYGARINGQDVGDLEAYRIVSPLFTLNLPENNVVGVEPVVAQAVVGGYSFIIAPPPPGEYEMVFFYSGDPEESIVTVTVIVEAVQVIEERPLSTTPGSTGPVESPPSPPATTESVDLDEGDGNEELREDVDRYCQLVHEIEDEFSALEIDENATDSDIARLRLDFIQAHEDLFDELLEVAPDEIRDDVRTLWQAQEQLAEGADASLPELERAEERITEFQRENCS